MMTRPILSTIRAGLTMAMCSVLLLTVGLTLGSVSADNPVGAPRALDDARPTVVPLSTAVPALPAATPTIVVRLSHPKVVDVGAHIQLNGMQADPKVLGLKAVVQWQGSQDEWYDVAGWQSVLTTSNVVWWVAPTDFGKGPFRWAIYRDDSAQPSYVSERFWLPRSAGAWVTVQIPS